MNREIGAPTFRGDIEGLRALAIIAVVGYHAGLAGFERGVSRWNAGHLTSMFARCLVSELSVLASKKR